MGFLCFRAFMTSVRCSDVILLRRGNCRFGVPSLSVLFTHDPLFPCFLQLNFLFKVCYSSFLLFLLNPLFSISLIKCTPLPYFFPPCHHSADHMTCWSLLLLSFLPPFSLSSYSSSSSSVHCSLSYCFILVLLPETLH